MFLIILFVYLLYHETPISFIDFVLLITLFEFIRETI